MGTKEKERRVYSKEFKAGAAALAGKHEKPVRQVAADLGINENMLHRWIQQAREAGGTDLPPFPGHGRPRDESNFSSRLPACGKKTRRRGRRCEAPLHSKSYKKRPDVSPRHLRAGETPVMVYRFMSEHRGEYTIREKDVSFWGQLRRLLPVGEVGRG
jgi:transposase-like protein